MQKKTNYKRHFFALSLSTILALFIFYNFFFKGLIPFPGNYMLAWYEPWKTDFSSNGTITIPHKPIADDVFRQLYPAKVLISESIKQFNFALWNPYNGAGMPFFATMHTGFLNPFNLLFVFLPKHIAWGIFVAIQPIFISFFTYIYCRKIGIKFFGALFSGITFTLSGPAIVRLLFGEYIYNFWLLPVILFLIESYTQNEKTKKVLFIPFVIAALLISGQPQITTYVLIFSISYFLFRFFQIKNYKQIRSFGSIFFIIILALIGVGITGIQLLPAIELFKQSGINPESSRFIFDRFLMPIEHLITILIPNYFGNQSTYNYWGSGDYIESIASIGLIPCLFAFAAISFKTKKNITPFLTITILLTIFLSIDWFLTRFLFSLPIPIISTGIPSRIYFITVFCISILGGYGFDKCMTLNKKELKTALSKIYKFIILVSVIFAGTLLLNAFKISCDNEFVLNCRNIALRNTLVETVGFVFALLLFFLYLFNKNKLKNIIPIGIILTTITIGIYNSNKFLPFSAKKNIMPPNILIEKIQNLTRDARVFGLGEANLKTDLATYFKIYDPNYYDPLYNKRYAELISFSNTENPSVTLPRSDIEITNEVNLDENVKFRRDRLFNFLSVKYLIYKKTDFLNKDDKEIVWQNNKWILSKNSSSIPRVYTVSSLEVIKDKDKILKRLFDPNFDPKKSVVVEENLPDAKITSSNIPGSVKIINYKENDVVITSNNQENQIMILTDNYYPGWKAYINNKETEIYRANYTFRAIFVPKGKHSITFKYQPEYLRIGAIISVFSLLILLIIFFKKYIFLSK